MILRYLPFKETLDRRQIQICEAFAEDKDGEIIDREMGFEDIIKKVKGLMGRNQCKKELDGLERQGIIFKNEWGKYKLRKEVACYSGSHEWFDTIEEVFKIEKPQWLDIEEVISPLKEELLEKGIYILKEYYVDFLPNVDNKEQPLMVSHDF